MTIIVFLIILFTTIHFYREDKRELKGFRTATYVLMFFSLMTFLGIFF